MSDALSGPLWAARNWNSHDGEGSIHNDETAEKLGFRGGTVAGDVHMNQFPPLLVEIFGNEWFERGSLSLNYKNATVDLEKVQVFAEPLADGAKQTKVWMEREDGLLVCTGTAGLDDHNETELRRKDFRPCEASELRILNQLHAGFDLGTYQVEATTDKQFYRFDNNLVSNPLDWYRDKEASPWEDVIAAPCTILEHLYGKPVEVLIANSKDNVGLFGAIEINQVNGPLLLNQTYTVKGEVVCVGQSPQTEYVWYESKAYRDDGTHVATLLMQSRVMKASSPLYSEA